MPQGPPSILLTLFLDLLLSFHYLHQTTLALSQPGPNHSSNNKFNFKVTPCNRICRYNSNFFNGEVCIGCYRDTSEISSWSQLTNVEKAFALEDAIDRCLSSQINGTGKEHVFEGAIDVRELRYQASRWLELSKEEMSVHEKKQKEQKVQLPIQSNNQIIEGNQVPSTDSCNIDNEYRQNVRNNQRLLTPCRSGKCSFDLNIFDGQVCKKCFRDKFEIHNWHRLNDEEKSIAFMDMNDRWIQSQIES